MNLEFARGLAAAAPHSPTALRPLGSGLHAFQKKFGWTPCLRVLSRAMVLAAMALAVQGPASAALVTVTFDTFLNQHFFDASNPVATSEGFDFTSGPLQHFHIGDDLNGSPGATSVLLQDIDDNIITMTKNGGGAFDLLSIFAAEEVFSIGDSLLVTGLFSGGGSISATFALSGALQQFSFAGFSNLTSVAFQAIGTDTLQTFWLDDLVANDAPAVSVVPEPPGWQLGVLGAVAVGLSTIRRRRAYRPVD